jgi:hypothetical protein
MHAFFLIVNSVFRNMEFHLREVCFDRVLSCIRAISSEMRVFSLQASVLCWMQLCSSVTGGNVNLPLCLTKYHVKKCIPSLINRHEDMWASGGTAPHILNLGTSWRWVVSFTPRPLYLRGKSPQYHLYRSSGGLQSLEAMAEKKLLIALSGLEPRLYSL